MPVTQQYIDNLIDGCNQHFNLKSVTPYKDENGLIPIGVPFELDEKQILYFKEKGYSAFANQTENKLTLHELSGAFKLCQ